MALWVKYNSEKYHKLEAAGYIESYRGSAPLVGLHELWSAMEPPRRVEEPCGCSILSDANGRKISRTLCADHEQKFQRMLFGEE